MFGISQEKEPNRFHKMMESHPKQYSYCMRDLDCGGLGIGEVLEYANIKH
jgi:hypothetical protein